ncbi:MAG: carboxypeptidase regulatory-like domain-containing protein [Chloroflexaceae bacterium]|nr:carboxypeptidase regulatory-like domain-containing protein [Chloroflexaceae bacterium]
MRDTNGNVLANAQVGLNVVGTTIGANTTTDSQGRYNAFLTLNNGLVAGDLNFNVVYETKTGKATTTLRQRFNATVNVLNELSVELVLDASAATLDQSTASRAAFSGTVRNSNSGYGLPGATLVIRGVDDDADLGTLCTTTTNDAGEYTCGSSFQTEAPLTVEYVVSLANTPLTDPISATYRLLPGTEFANSYLRDITVAPTTVRLHGKVTELTSRPLNRATFEVLSPVAATVQTDDQGDYELFFALPPGISNGTVNYRVSYGNVQQTGTQDLSNLTAGALNILPAVNTALPFTARSIVLQGTITNAVLPELRAGIRVQISTAERGTVCDVLTNSQGIYRCTVNLENDAPFTASYRVAGEPALVNGQPFVLALTIDNADINLQLPQAGGERVFDYDFTASPTVVRLTGVVQNEQGTLLQNATITLSGLSEATATTDANGTYTIVSIAATDTLSGELQLQGSFGNRSGVATVPANLTARAINEFSQNLTLQPPPGDGTAPPTARTLYFQGRVTSNQVAGTTLPVDGAQVVVRTPDDPDTAWCETTTNAQGYYTCPVQVTSADPFAVQIDVTQRGNASFVTDITSIPPAGGVASLVRNFTVEPTLLYFFGKVTGDGETPLANATVTVNDRGSTTTRNNGTYSIYLFEDNGTTGGTITYRVRSGSDTVIETGDYSVSADTITLIERDLTLTGRELVFTGQVIHELVPALPMSRLQVEVINPDVGTLCTTTTRNDATYTCKARITWDDPFPIIYRMSGDWGTFEIDGYVNYVPPAGTSIDYPLTLFVAPTTLKLDVGLTGTDGTPLANRWVTIGGDASAELTSDAGGDFSTYLLFGADADTATLALRVSHPSNSLTDQIVVPLTPGDLTEYEEQVIFPALRVLGTVTNGADPLSGATVRLSGAANAQTTTASDGTYGSTVLFSTGTTTATFTVRVENNGLTVVQPISMPIQPTQFNQRTVDIAFTVRRLTIQGRVVNAYNTNVGIPSQRVIVRADGIGEWCATWTNTNGEYTCPAIDVTGDTFAYTVAVAGVWGSTEESYTVSGAAMPDAGAAGTVSNNTVVQANTLRLYGKITNQNGTALNGAIIEVSGDGYARVTSNAAGNYEAWLVFAPDTTSANLSLRFSYGSVSLGNSTQQEVNLTVPLQTDQLNERQEDIVFALRRLNMNGSVTHELSNALTFWRQGTRVELRAPGIGLFCTYSYRSNNSPSTYTCPPVDTTRDTFPYSITVRGEWGSRVFEREIGSAEMPGDGEQATFTDDLTIRTTILRLYGTVTAPDSTPFANATVQLSGDATGYATTDASGTYEMLVMLPTDASSADLRLQVQSGISAPSFYREFTIDPLAPGGPDNLNEYEQSVVLEERQLWISGAIVNEFGPTMNLQGMRYELSAPGLEGWCSGTIWYDTDTQTNRYSCNQVTIISNPFDVIGTISDDWGETVLTYRIDDSAPPPNGLPPVGQSANVTLNLTARATTLRLSGVVRDDEGNPVPNATVRATGPHLFIDADNTPGVATTDATGAYEMDVILRSNQTDPLIVFEIMANNATERFSRDLPTLADYQYHEVTNDFALSERSLVLITNITDPNTSKPLFGNYATVTSPQLGNLCQIWTSSGRQGFETLICDRMLPLDAPFDVTVTVNGEWGTDTRTITIDPGSGSGEVKRTISIEPDLTSVLVSGTVLDGPVPRSPTIRSNSWASNRSARSSTQWSRSTIATPEPTHRAALAIGSTCYPVRSRTAP